ncbi:MAG TPA: hypothetical protein VEB40_12305 [Flavipsychrobacter sp.]|nr:hypothetical protein [Flavipsychrobacter sp.]
MAKTKADSGISEERLSLYDELIKDLKDIERKGASMPYTSFNGHMFSFLAKDGSLALRLPAEERDEFIVKHKASLCEAHGTVLKEYVAVPEKLFKKKDQMKDYFRISLNYVKSLKPKPTKKK